MKANVQEMSLLPDLALLVLSQLQHPAVRHLEPAKRRTRPTELLKTSDATLENVVVHQGGEESSPALTQSHVAFEA